MIYVIQNDPEAPPGTLAVWLEELRVPNRLVKVFSGDECPTDASVSALIVLGGTMGACDADRYPFLGKVKSLIHMAMTRDIPYLGICLGGQLLADVLGARIHTGKNGEKGLLQITIKEGMIDDPLLDGLPAVFPTFQWHDDCFEIPEGAVHLATSTTCPNQAFRYGAGVYGLQFHPELDRKIVANWTGSNDGDELSRDILTNYLRSERAYQAVAKSLFGNFVRLVRRSD